MAVLARVRKYIPEVADNRAKPENEQIRAFLKPVSVYTKQVQLRKFLGMAPEELLKQMMKDEGSNEIKKILKDTVVRLENLYLEDEDGKNRMEATIQDVWEMGEFELVMELFNNILSHSQLKKDEEKNSELPSGTSVTPAVH